MNESFSNFLFCFQLSGEEVRGEQADPEALSVLQISEMSSRRNEAKLGYDWRRQGKPIKLIRLKKFNNIGL